MGESLFDDRYGLAKQKPKALQKMTRFPNDSLDAALCHGDLLLQICANTQDTVIHAPLSASASPDRSDHQIVIPPPTR